MGQDPRTKLQLSIDLTHPFIQKPQGHSRYETGQNSGVPRELRDDWNSVSFLIKNKVLKNLASRSNREIKRGEREKKTRKGKVQNAMLKLSPLL